MPFDHDLDFGPDCLAHGRDDVDRELTVLRVHRSPGGAEGIEFERLVATPIDHRRSLGEALRRTWPGVPAVGVGREIGVVAPAEQIVDRPSRSPCR